MHTRLGVDLLYSKNIQASNKRGKPINFEKKKYLSKLPAGAVVIVWYRTMYFHSNLSRKDVNISSQLQTEREGSVIDALECASPPHPPSYRKEYRRVALWYGHRNYRWSGETGRWISRTSTFEMPQVHTTDAGFDGHRGFIDGAASSTLEGLPSSCGVKTHV